MKMNMMSEKMMGNLENIYAGYTLYVDGHLCNDPW